MGQEGFTGEQITTQKGKVVYKRKKHVFTIDDIIRIAISYNNNTPVEKMTETAQAIKIRLLFKIASSIYSNVSFMFDKPNEVSDDEYERIKDIWREGNDELVGMISLWIATKSGVPQLGLVLNTVGRMINRGMEYIFTGSTDF